MSSTSFDLNLLLVFEAIDGREAFQGRRVSGNATAGGQRGVGTDAADLRGAARGPGGRDAADPAGAAPYVLTQEAARFLGLPPRTMEKRRTYGTSPAYSKMGGRVVYAIANLTAWAQSGLRNGTSDDVPGAPLPAKPRSAYELYRLGRL